MKKIYPNLDLSNSSNSFLSYLHRKKISLLIAFVTFFGFSNAFGQALLPLYNTDATIAQAGWGYGAGLDVIAGNYDCAGAGNYVIRFNSTTNEFAVVNYATAATNVSFNIQRTNNNAKTLLVEESDDGITYTTAGTVTTLQVPTNNFTYTLNYALNATSRFVRFNMTALTAGTYTLDGIAVYNSTAPTCVCISYPTSNDGLGITSTTVGSATFSVADVTYYNYTGSIPNLTAGSSVTSSITFATGFTYDSHIWIDFNDDGLFNNTTEKVYSGVSTGANPTILNTTFTMPAGATPGQHKMRIGTADSGQATPTPCYSGTYGVTIELFVNIIAATPPTITSFTPSSACASSSATVVITGTNFTGATTVTIGGTAVSSFVINSATQITATVGTGTTGTIAVTTAGGTATSGGTFTVNALPANPGNPTSNSPQCNPPGVTLTRSGTPAAGITWYWQTTAGGTSTANSGATYVVTTSAPYYIRAQDNATGCWSSGAGSLAVTITPNITAIAGTPSPANNATGVCYAGSGPITSISWSAVAGAASYDVYFGAGATPPVVLTANVLTNSYTTGTLLPNTTYSWKIVPRNTCGITSGTPANWQFTTASTPCYCTPTSVGPQYVYVNDIRFMGTLNDVDNLASGYSTGYQNWTALPKAIQAQGEGINVYYNNTSYTGSAHVKAWVDWNKNGVFDTGELVYDTGLTTTSSATFGFVIPPATVPGDYRIRIRNNVTFDYNVFNYINYDFNPCENFIYTASQEYDGEAEDYLFTVIASCSANIVTVTDGENCGSGTVALSFTGTTGTTGFNIYTNETGGSPLSPAPTFTSPGGIPTGSWTTPSLGTTTTYWITATNGSCQSLKRTKIVAEISPLPTVSFTPSAPVVCGDNTILQLTAGGDIETVFLINENFEGGGLGVFTNINNNPNGAPYDAITVWQNQTSPYIPTNTEVWSPAISSGLNGNKFVMSTSDVNPPGNVRQFLQLTSAVDATNMTGLTLTFDMYYSAFGDQVRIQANSGSGWTNVVSYTTSIGIGTRFTNIPVDLSAFNNSPSLLIRIQFLSGWGDGVAVDNIKLFGQRPLNTAFNYDTSVVDAFTNVACTPIYAYVSGSPATTIWIKPTTLQLENPSFSIPVTATLSNGCSATGSVVITNNTRTWQGLTTDWNSLTNWKPAAVPTIDDCVIIPSNTVISGTNFNAYGKNLIVRNSGNLNIQSSNNLTIADGIVVEPSGTFQIENNSNLVQINNVVNTGDIIYKRIAPNIKGSDYVYWSSPVFNQALGSIYTTPTQGPKYEWNTLINNGNGTGGNTSHGNWVSPTATMATGKGYIVRGSSSFGMAATNINSTFTGRPNNGNIPVTVYRGTYTGGGYTGANGIPINNLDDNYNLIGNPYPSAINALKFISDNSTVIEGNVKLWTHGTDPAANGGTITNPFYGTFANNYSADDYITLNNSGPSKAGYSLNIKSGQGFFVEMLDGAQGSGSVTFNNTQRRDNLGIPYANDAFYKNSNQQYTNLDDLERHRIWLDIKNAANTSEVTLVGYIEGATINKESSYDAIASTLTMGIYSFINGESFVIQGRGLPFDDNDQVAIGFNVPTAGTYSIGINTADGLFLGNQDIYLKDELLNVYHDLKTVPYSFTATTGIHDDRFKLVYKNTVLSNETFSTNEIQIAKNNNIIEIVSGNEIMDNVKVYDVRGRLIIEKSKINNNSISIDMVGIQDQVLIVNIVTAEGIKVTRKIL